MHADEIQSIYDGGFVPRMHVQLSTARRHRRAERPVHSLMRYVLVPDAGPPVTVDQRHGSISEMKCH
jgi:hypothetical protein